MKPTSYPVAGIPGAFIDITYEHVTETLGNGTRFTWLRPIVAYRFTHEDNSAVWRPDRGTISLFGPNIRRSSWDQPLDDNALMVQRLLLGAIPWVCLQLKIRLNKAAGFNLLKSKINREFPFPAVKRVGHPCAGFDEVFSMTPEQMANRVAEAFQQAQEENLKDPCYSGIRR